MFTFPPIPPYEGLHPIVVHFPVALLLIAWLPMLIALIDKKRRNTWLTSAALLLIVGTIAAFAAVMTGEATEDAVAITTQTIDDAVHEHEEAAELARNLFIAVTAIFIAGWIVATKLPEKKKKPAAIAATILIAFSYATAALTLANAAHQGGVLVHQYGVHAPIINPGTTNALNPNTNADSHDDDDDE